MHTGNVAEAVPSFFKNGERDIIIALAGNPNVGKSTVFNQLTGLRQHTGNWPGKTVAAAWGYCSGNEGRYKLVDLPGCYSLMSHSAEEQIARDFICSGGADAIIIVCDATCLERNLNIVLQTLEITRNVVVCVNLMDEAEKKKIQLDLELLSETLGVPVIGTSARSKLGLDALMREVRHVIEKTKNQSPLRITYPDYIENAASTLEPYVEAFCGETVSPRWFSVMLLYGGSDLWRLFEGRSKSEAYHVVAPLLSEIRDGFKRGGITRRQIEDDIVFSLIRTAEEICGSSVQIGDSDYKDADFRIDRILTGRWTAFPIMFLALLGIFWLTISGANIPSMALSSIFSWTEYRLLYLCNLAGLPEKISEMLIIGVYRVVAWVVSVMLPPMAIFFPLFTLMEDVGILPRIAFNLDKCFKKCCACGKQALTMCMGFGCNAAGVIGCRIIDSPRERHIAIITNNFVPCNGRFPTLIAIISMFFVGVNPSLVKSMLSAAFLVCLIVLGILITFAVSFILSKTILKGLPSSFTLELPPYRRPQFGRVIIRSVFDRTLFVLLRAVSVAVPAGLLIWLMANVSFGNETLLALCSGVLDPFARLMGLDGVIMLAFILGFPANEIVIPIIIMSYMASESIVAISDLTVLRQLLTDNGWTWATAVSVMLFSLIHWPCSTTCLTIKQETQSIKWTAASIAIPASLGIVVCVIFTAAIRMLSG